MDLNIGELEKQYTFKFENKNDLIISIIPRDYSGDMNFQNGSIESLKRKFENNDLCYSSQVFEYAKYLSLSKCDCLFEIQEIGCIALDDGISWNGIDENGNPTGGSTIDSRFIKRQFLIKCK